MRPNDNSDPSSSKAALRECLASLGLPPGLLSSAYRSHLNCESRLWLLDNSSQMKVKDSHVGRGGKEAGSIERVDEVTRWEELRECVEFHAEMSSSCWMPTKFWLVNDPAKSVVKWQRQPWERYSQKFNLCHGTKKDVLSEMNLIRHVMKNATLDQRQCPLATSLRGLSRGLAKQGAAVAARGGHVTLVLCTQGRPTDKDGHCGVNTLVKFQNELASFSNLPVRVIVRLCTDDEKVRDIYNTLDGKFDAIDVLDDFWGEALEVYLHNPFLTYAMGLHRLRESGLAPALMDELDTRPLCLDEIHQLCLTLFVGEDGGGFDLPHPQEDWDGFLGALKMLVDNEKAQWNPIRKRPTAWINIRKLEAMHGGGDKSDYLRHSMHNSFSAKHKHTTYTSRKGAPERDAPREEHHRARTGHASGHSRERTSTSHSHESRPSHSRESHSSHSHKNHSSHSRERHSTHSRERRSSRPSQDKPRREHKHRKPEPQDQPHPQPSDEAEADTAPAAGGDCTLALLEVLQRWSHQPPDYETAHSLDYILVTVPRTFPPTNEHVEPHEYFAKWKAFDKEAFNDSGDQQEELLRRAVRKAKFFLHPDKLPKDLTENQTLLFKTIWDVIQDREEAAGED